jgi:tRNA(Ile)-lysidine synthase
MHKLQQQILRYIHRNHLFRNGDKTLVAVSGGSDSVCLLHVLASLRETLGITPFAVYIDHGLRPLETGDEKSLVKSLAVQLGIDFEAAEVDVKGLAREKKLSLEHAARELRYQALREIAADHDASSIAVAHTADDQAEEILLRLLRGSGRKGVSGMRPRQRDIVRPLLEIEKKDMRAYLQDMDILFLEDSSNADPRFLRNRVRHQLIPFLEENFDAGVRQALRKTAECLAEDEDLLEELTEIAWDQVAKKISRAEQSGSGKVLIGRKSFAKQPGALQRRIIERLLWEIGSRASYTHILQVVETVTRGRTGSELHLARGLRVGVRKKYVEFLYPKGHRAWRGRLYGRGR